MSTDCPWSVAIEVLVNRDEVQGTCVKLPSSRSCTWSSDHPSDIRRSLECIELLPHNLSLALLLAFFLGARMGDVSKLVGCLELVRDMATIAEFWQ